MKVILESWYLSLKISRTSHNAPLWMGVHIWTHRLFLITLLPSGRSYGNPSSSSELRDQRPASLRPASLSFEDEGCYFTRLFETELSSVAASLEEDKNAAETQIAWLTTSSSYLGKQYICTGNKSVHPPFPFRANTLISGLGESGRKWLHLSKLVTKR